MQVHDDEALRILDIIGRAFVRLEQNVPPPERVPYLDDYVYRYQEKTIEQAIVLNWHEEPARSVPHLFFIRIHTFKNKRPCNV